MTIWNGLTSDGAVVPIQVDDQGRVVAVGSGPDSPLVVDGDYLRPRDPDLGLGTANINLDAAGGAVFAGGILSGGDPTNGAETGFQGNSSGVMRAARADDANLFEGYAVGTSTATSQIRPNGSAVFAGTITSEGRDVITTQTGSWVPKASDGSVSYNAEKCYWVRNGSLVTVAGNVNNFTQTNDSTPVILSGCPYSAIAESYGIAAASGAACGPSANRPVVMAYVLKDSDGGGIKFSSSAPDNGDNAEALLYVNLASSQTLYFQITYRTDDETWKPRTFRGLVRPDASTMPSPLPDASTMPSLPSEPR